MLNFFGQKWLKLGPNPEKPSNEPSETRFVYQNRTMDPQNILNFELMNFSNLKLLISSFSFKKLKSKK